MNKEINYKGVKKIHYSEMKFNEMKIQLKWKRQSIKRSFKKKIKRYH